MLINTIKTIAVFIAAYVAIAVAAHMALVATYGVDGVTSATVHAMRDIKHSMLDDYFGPMPAERRCEDTDTLTDYQGNYTLCVWDLTPAE